MSIRKRTYKSGKQKWEVNYRDADGKRHNKVCPTLAAAKHFEAQVLKEKFEEKELGVKSTKEVEWGTLCKDFLRFSETNNKFQTHRSNKLSIKHFTEFFNEKIPRGKIYLSDITAKMIEDYKTKRKKEVSNATINRELACLRYMFNLAVEWDIDGVLNTKKIKLLENPPGRLRYLTEDEIQEIIKNAIPLHLKVFYIIAFTTGMRKSEILNLKWKDIDLKEGILLIEITKSGKRREVYISKPVCQLLKWWKQQIGKVYELHRIKHYYPPVNEEEVFAIKDIKRAHKTACEKAGIEDFRIHDCRHTAATLFRTQGTELDTLMEILGHSTIKMTMRYAHIGSEEKQKAAKNIVTVLLPCDTTNNLSSIKPTTKKPRK